MITDLWQRAATRQPPLSWPGAAALALVAVALTWHRGGRLPVRRFSTMIHESGHALASLLTGGRVRGMRLHADGSGLTWSRGAPGWRRVVVLAAGYPAPALAGLAGAQMVAAGYHAGLLVGLVALCAVLLVVLRNLFGVWLAVATGAGVSLLSWLAPPVLLSVTAYLVVWSLLFASARDMVDLHRSRSTPAYRGSDPAQLARLTGIPAGVWLALGALIAAGSLFLGAARLLGVAAT